MTTPRDPDGLREQSIGDLLKQLSQETSTLVRQEMALARAELTEKGKRAGAGAGMLGGAGVAGLLALQGRNKVQEAAPPVPEQTVETLKEDVEWAKTQRPSGAR